MTKFVTIFLVLYCLLIPEIHGAAVKREKQPHSEGSFNAGIQAGYNGFTATLNKMFGGLSNSKGLFADLNKVIDKLSKAFEKLEDGLEDFLMDLLTLLPGIDREVINGTKSRFLNVNGTEVSGFKGVLLTALELPIKIPMTILEFGFNTIWDVLSLQFNIAKIPIDAVMKVLSIVQLIILAIFTSILDILMKIEGVDSKILNSGISLLKDFSKFVISNVASVEIFGIQTGFDALGFVRGRIDFVVQHIIDVIFFAMETAWTFIMKVKDTFKLDAILHLPIISDFVGLGEKFVEAVYQFIHGQLEGLIQFGFTIIEDHQDFFIPLFAKITNFFTAIINAARQIYSGDFNGGFEAMFGPLKIAFNSFNATGDWNMTILDGVTLYGNLAIDSFCQSVGRKPKSLCPP